MEEKKKKNKMDNKIYFYKKINRKIEPVFDKKTNLLAKKRLNLFFSKQKEYRIPENFINNWDKVALYSPKGDVNNADSLIINIDDGAYSLKNKLNDLTGKEWIKFTCSWFVFNALKKDLEQEKNIDPKMESHPATFSPTMVADFIKFFTKKGENVFDPFLGIGSTLEACKRTGRIGFGTELNEKYFNFCKKRTPEFSNNIFNEDARNISKLNLPLIDFSISSPPYWNILNRSTRDFKKNRLKKSLDVNYSEKENDLGNIDDYEKFIDETAKVYFSLYDKLRDNAYIVVIIKNVKQNGKFFPLAWDLAKKLSEKYILKDEKIWIQDKIGLAPYGYPFSWTSNILHHYCLILRKE